MCIQLYNSYAMLLKRPFRNECNTQNESNDHSQVQYLIIIQIEAKIIADVNEDLKNEYLFFG